jgi:serine/threonine protein kinase
MSKPKVIGEGAYGCVHKPSLTCKNKPKLSYNNKVSKVLTKKAAKIEIKEYKNLKDADKKNDYYVGKPLSCEIENNPVNIESIEKCKIGTNVINDLQHHKLIIMGDGGINVEEYVKKIKKWSPSMLSRNDTELFLLESLRLFSGLIKFKENDLVHHDLKPQNIVYNEEENRLNFIDFGLMVSKTKKIKESNENKNNLGIFHWSFPWEIEYVNKAEFTNLKKKNKQYRKTIYDSLIEDFVNRNYKNTHVDHMHNYFYYVLNSTINRDNYRKERGIYLNDYKRFLTDEVETYEYDDFLEKSIDTIDSYGLGFTMMHWLLYVEKFLDTKISEKLYVLYYQMITPNLIGRLRIEEATNLLENIILESGLLEKHKKEINEHIVRDKLENPDKKIDKSDQMLKHAKPDIVVNREIIMSTPGEDCPPGKERNPNTRRCINKCKPTYLRNSDFKCIREKRVANRISSSKNKTLKICPPNKERNPKTRRCINKCKSGYIRNSDFKCVRENSGKN